MPTDAPMLLFDDVHKAFGRVRVLRGLQMRIDEPGFHAVMGPSGSGKTTFLHLAAGLDRPDAGRVLVGGQPLGQMSDRRRTAFRRSNIGVVFQQFNLIPTLTARQNVALPAVIEGRPRRWIDPRVDQLLDELGMSPRASHRPDALSGGEQQRVAIARALLFDPVLLLADEPTGALDSANSELLWKLLGQLADRHGTTVVMVTHEAAAAAHCRDVFVLRDGQVRGQFDVEGLDASGVASRYQELDQPA